MADIFTTLDVRQVVEHRIIWLLGDSNVRAIYKDLVWLLQKNTLIDLSSLRNKLEGSHMNDRLIKGKEIHKGRNYVEVRSFQDSVLSTKIEFTFVTECLSNEIRDKLVHLSPSDTPDVIVMNSCLWDITRWGPEGVSRFKQNIRELFQLFKNHLPSNTLIIWLTTPPISAEPIGGFLIKQINFMKPFLRFEVMEANVFLREEVVRYGFDLLDIHYHLMHQIHRRRPDGIHWNPDAVRHMTNLLLTHMSLSLGVPLPGNFSSPILDNMIYAKENESDTNNNNVTFTGDGVAVRSKVIVPPPKPAEPVKEPPQTPTISSNTLKNRRKRQSRRDRARRLQNENMHYEQNAQFMYGQYQNMKNMCGKVKNNFNWQRRNDYYYRPY